MKSQKQCSLWADAETETWAIAMIFVSNTTFIRIYFDFVSGDCHINDKSLQGRSIQNLHKV